MKFVRFFLFNYFTNYALKQGEKSKFLNRRLKSANTDFSFIITVFFPLLIIFSIPQFIHEANDISGRFDLNITFIISLFAFSITTFGILNKDYYGAKSVAKRIYGYKICDVKTKEVASSVQCAVRNFTMVIWPIEVIFLLLNPSRRLGDFIAGTILKDAEPELPESILNDIKNPSSYRSAKLTFSLSIIVVALMMYILLLPMLRVTTLST